MCAVSMVTQHWYDKYPTPWQFPASEYWDYTELVRKAKMYDELMKQADCPDPTKQEWHRSIVDKFEKQQPRSQTITWSSI